MTKTEKIDNLINEINKLRRAESTVLARASKYGVIAAEARAKEVNLIAEARVIQNERYKLSLEYNKIKNPCPDVLAQAEKALGRRLTYEEVIEIEQVYAKKTNRTSSMAQ